MACKKKLKQSKWDKNQKQIWQKKENRKKTPKNKLKANNMNLMLHVHNCKLNSLSNKMMLWVVM